MMQCPDEIKRLIDRFNQQSDHVRSPDYNETLIRIDYINPMMKALGWDIDNSQGFAEQYREVVHEDRVKVAGQTKAPDYSFRVGGQRKFFLEAKKPSVDIRTSWEPAYQLRRYAWSAKMACSLLTDFEEFAIYDTRIQPKQFDKASIARREYIKYTDYPDRWDFLHGTFSKEAVLKGEFDRYCESKKGRGAQLFDDAFLGEIEEWRKHLATNLARRNESLDGPSLNFAVQRIIDRIIFLRIAEDRGTEPVGQLQALLSGDEAYERLCALFRRADERYNSGLFHFQKEKDRDEAPDTLTPSLQLDDKTLKSILKALYYPQSPYEFTMVSADILGSVYERFLGKVITLTAGHSARIEEKPEVRKAGGVYYTPTYIVDYIVTNTVGKLLEGKTPKAAAKIKVLDPACGSGSFLIGAYQFLLDWYHKQYLVADPAALATGKKPILRPTPQGGWALTSAERKRILLDHIHGVDLDGQAVEVTKLNLLLKCLEGETSQTLGFEQRRLFHERALPDLGKNILCGNSLIGTDIIGTEAWNQMSEEEQRRINPFDYERAFPQVFKGKDKGFDAVIGNPPYVNAWDLYEDSPHVRDLINETGTFKTAERHWDLYVLFLEKSISIVRSGGRFSFIIPYSYAIQKYGRSSRNLLLTQTSLESIADLRTVRVFGRVPVITMIPVAVKGLPTRGAKTVILRPGPTATPTHPGTIEPSHNVKQARFLDQTEEMLRLDLSDAADTLCSKLTESSITIGHLCLVNYGAQMSSREKGKFGKDHVLRDKANTKTCRMTVGGRDLYRYRATWRGRYVEWALASEMYGPRDPSFFELPKLMIRDITGTHRLEITFDDTKLYCDHTILLAQRFAEATRWRQFDPESVERSRAYSYELLTGLLCSRAVSAFYYLKLTGEGVRTGGGFHTYPKTIRVLPVFDLEQASPSQTVAVKKIETCAAKMLSLHKRLSTETHPQHREQIQREIDVTDRQIDQLVYELYGLTEEEIRIVEEATK
ncbi:MAG: N-6 DNA methylase [Phycisphaeraceae bacterium]